VLRPGTPGEVARIVTFLEGGTLTGSDYLRPPVVEGLGALSGMVNRALTDFEHEGVHRTLQWDLRHATRVIDAGGRAVAERLVAPGDDPEPLAAGQTERALQVPLIVGGEPVAPFDAVAAREHNARARAELRPDWLALEPGEPALHGGSAKPLPTATHTTEEVRP
jgi:hypothetical protein